MNWQENFEATLNYFGDTDSQYSLGRNRNLFKQNVEDMIGVFKLLEKDQNVTIKDIFKSNIKSSLNILTKLILDEVITDKFYKFIKSYCLIISNWNDNIKGPQDISLSVRILDRYVDYHFTSIEALRNLKELNKKIRMYEHYNIPGIKLSKHYADSTNINK